MNFQIDKEKLLKTLNKISLIYHDQSEIEILECLYLELKNNILTFKSTNLMCKIICTLKVESSSEGITVVNFKSLHGIIKNLSEPKLYILIENNQLIIKTKAKKFGISTYPSDNYPEINIENAEKINIDITNFNKILPKFDKIFGKEFPVNHLCFVSNSNIIELVGTNGNKLSYCKIKNETGKDFKILLDSRSFPILKSFLKSESSINIEMSERELILYNTEIKLVLNYHQEFKFPPYEFLLNIKYNNFITIKKSELEETLKLLMANLKDERIVTIDITETAFTILYKSASFECEQIISLDKTTEDLNIQLKLNVENLLESIKHINDDKIIIKFNDKTTPLRLESEKENKENYIAYITLCV